jgi:hypothetical protein
MHAFLSCENVLQCEKAVLFKENPLFSVCHVLLNFMLQCQVLKKKLISNIHKF